MRKKFNLGGKVTKAKDGLYANIHAKRNRIKAGSGETMRSPEVKEHQQHQILRGQQKQLKNHNAF